MTNKTSPKKPTGKMKSSVIVSGIGEDILSQLAGSLEHTPGTVMLADSEGRIRFINKSLSDLSGFQPDEMIDRSMASFWNQPSESTQQIMTRLYSERIWQGEIQHKTKHGGHFWELSSISVIPDEDGLINGFLILGQDISEKKVAQDTHLLQNGVNGAIPDILGIGLIEIDLRGVIVYANEGAASIYRRPVKELMKSGFRDFMAQEEAERIADIFDDMFRNGGISKKTITYDIIGKDGAIVPCEGVITFLKDGTEQPVGFGCFIREITETKKIETALKESEKSYRQLINSAPYSITINRSDNAAYVLVNRAFLERTGYKQEEVIGRNVRELGLYANEEDQARLETRFREQGRLDDFELQIKTKTGEITELLLSGRPIIFKGEPCNLFISTNIDALKKTQRELMESEESARRIIESAPFSIVITRLSDFTYVQVNETFCRRTGYSREETIGKTGLDQNIYADTSELEKIWEKYKQTGRAHGVEIQHRAKDGHLLDSLVSISAIRFKGEDCLLTISADLTERKRIDRELEQYRLHLEDMVKDRTQALEEAQNELVKREKLSVLGQLTATVSHELRNPLGVIRSSAYYVQKKVKDKNEKIDKHLNRIEEQVQVCDTIVEDLLEYTRGRNLSTINDDLTPWIKEVIGSMEESESIHIKQYLSKALPVVSYDPEKIRRVMINILNNSVHAVEERQRFELKEGEKYKPMISVKTESEDGDIFIEFTDNGIGMSEETLKDAFEPLFTTRSRGTGIGLANVRKIIAEHNGEVFLESRYREGTKITITLPIAHK